MQEFVDWIEFQSVDDRMTLETYGTYWQIDHAISLAKVDITKPVNQEFTCNAINLRPLSKEKTGLRETKSAHG